MRDERRIERILKAVANKRRLAILSYLSTSDRASVGDIAEKIGLSFKSTSRHLSILSGAEILEREQESTTAWYRLEKPLSPVVKVLIAIL